MLSSDVEGWCIVCVAESNLQTFPPSQGKISGGSNPLRDADGINDYSLLVSLFYYTSWDVETLSSASYW